MKTRGPLTGQRVVVVGLARSGVGAANLLARAGADVTVTDAKTEGELGAAAGRLLPSVRKVLGGHPEELFAAPGLVIVSPGVPSGLAQFNLARRSGMTVIGELEFAFRVLDGQYAVEGIPGPVPFLAVTGTNGKSTTTTLLDRMMRQGKHRTLFGGNIGNALSEEIGALLAADGSGPSGTPDFVVAEISSFQLELIDTFRPRVASILNLTPDHMDRYETLDEYGDAKAAVFTNQAEGDSLVLNADDPELLAVCERKLGTMKKRPRVCYFSRQREVEGVYLKEGVIYMNPGKAGKTVTGPLIDASGVRIKGVHNLENAMAAAAMALLAECSPEAVRAALEEFEGLEHRIEPVRELDGVLYINDSKGTNVGAVVKSLLGFDRPVILIAGGRDKEGDFSLLRDAARGRVKAAVLIGEASGKIAAALGDIVPTVMAGDLRDAVTRSRELAAPGDVVLLSPACASFDMFRDFEDRGRQFKSIVSGIGAGPGGRG